MNTTRRLVEAMDSTSTSREYNAERRGEGSSGTGRGTMHPSTPPPAYSESELPFSHSPVERYIRGDGKIGVIMSTGYDGGWSTKIRILLDPSDPTNLWKTRKMQEVAIFDKEVVAAVLEGHNQQALMIGVAKMGLPIQNRNSFNNVQLSIGWVNPGDEFEVADAPGFEMIRLKNFIDWWRA